MSPNFLENRKYLKREGEKKRGKEPNMFELGIFPPDTDTVGRYQMILYHLPFDTQLSSSWDVSMPWAVSKKNGVCYHSLKSSGLETNPAIPSNPESEG